MGPYAEWVAGAVDALELYAPVTADHIMDAEDGATEADRRLRLMGYKRYAGPYIRAAQPQNMDRIKDFESKQNPPRIASELRIHNSYEDGDA